MHQQRLGCISVSGAGDIVRHKICRWIDCFAQDLNGRHHKWAWVGNGCPSFRFYIWPESTGRNKLWHQSWIFSICCGESVSTFWILFSLLCFFGLFPIFCLNEISSFIEVAQQGHELFPRKMQCIIQVSCNWMEVPWFLFMLVIWTVVIKTFLVI